MTLPKTQTDAVLDYLKKVGPITQKDAIDSLGCYRLGARIFDIRRRGIPIVTTYHPTGKGGGHYARYSLEDTQ